MKKATGLITIILGLIISSCDKKNASFVNRRTATHEKIEKTKEAQRAKAQAEAKQEEKEEPKQESTDSVVIQPQHQSPPSVLAPSQTPVVDNVIAVVDDDRGSSSVPRLAQSEVLSSQEQVSETTKDKDPAPIPEPVTKPDSEPEFVVKLVDYIPQAKPETMPALSLTLEAPETSAQWWQAYRDLEELSDKDKAIKAQTQNKEFENFERLFEETEEEEAERSKMEKQMKEAEELQRDRLSKEEQMRSFEFAAMQKAEVEQRARLKAAKEEQKAKLKEQGAGLRAYRINLRAEAEKRAYDGSGFEELFNEDKILGAEDIKENTERRQMKESEALQRDRLSKEEQMMNLEFAAMQKAEAEQKARLEERAKIWADYLAEYPGVGIADYYATRPIEAQEEADYWYKRKQEAKRKSEERREIDRETARLLEIKRKREERKREEERQADIRRNKESKAERESRYRKRDIQTIKLTN
ncbi:hypothetical protein AGMMS49592_4790 [Endomicrobiia bacterium]|nr:hypothetical protein AGMMS49592_4790 [Endomicrobiia bacterium]